MGTYVTYAVTVTNNGPGSQLGAIEVGGSIPAGLSLYSVSGSGWTCTSGGALGSCS